LKSYFFKIGNVNFSIFSDVHLKALNTYKYRKYQIDKNNSQFDLFFEELKEERCEDCSYKLSFQDKTRLSDSVGWAKYWSKYKVIDFKQIASKLKLCIQHPYMNQIGFSFNRIIIRNFLLKKIYYIYPNEKKPIFSDLAFHAMYRNLIAPFFLLYSSAILHGAAVNIGGKIAVFIAPDEGGKTTVVTKFNQNKILSDDQILIKMEKDRINVYSTPFGTLGNSLQKGELGGIFYLKKSNKFQLLPMSKTDLIKFLWNEHKLTWVTLPKKLRFVAFNLITDFCYYAPIYKMEFPIDYIDWDEIDKVMKVK